MKSIKQLYSNVWSGGKYEIFFAAEPLLPVTGIIGRIMEALLFCHGGYTHIGLIGRVDDLITVFVFFNQRWGQRIKFKSPAAQPGYFF